MLNHFIKFLTIFKIYRQYLGQAFVKTDIILDLRENITAFSYAPGFKSLYSTSRKINNFMIKKKMITKKLDSTKFSIQMPEPYTGTPTSLCTKFWVR